MSEGTAFGQWVKQRRKSLDITQEQLADVLGCSPAAIYKIEAGTRKPSRQVAQRLAESLQVPELDREEFVRFARLGTYNGQFGPVRPNSTLDRERHAPDEWTDRTTGLPVWINELIGRDEDIDRLGRLILESSVRLVTLIGPPGIGKTRLSAAVTSRLQSKFAHGVHFVALAPVLDHTLVISTIAASLGLQESGAQAFLELVANYFQDKQALLVLDNFEQVVEAAPQLAYLLTRCPGLRVLITSREVLGLQGERQYPVQPLALPSANEQPENLQAYAATVLFVERARAVQPSFHITEENAQSIALLCRRLDGLPLAIELAAARMKLLSPQEVLLRLRQGRHLPGSGARDLPARHQTLRAAIAWSHDLLSEGERALFRRLGCFAGGCSLDAVEAVCHAQGDLSGGVLEGLASLHDKSLLQRSEADGESRFWMLETIREYALELMSDSAECNEIARLHAEYYLAMAESTDPTLAGPSQGSLLDRLEMEHDNLRAALKWYLDGSASDEDSAINALRLTSALRWLWQRRGHLTEGRNWHRQVLDRTEWLTSPEGLKARARAILHSAELAYTQSDHVGANPLYEEALSLFEQLRDERGAAFALAFLGVLAGYYGKDRARGRRLLDRSIALFRRTGDRWGLARALCFRAYIPFAQGSYRAARPFLEESLALFREIADEWAAAWVMLVLGESERCQGKYKIAESLYEQSEHIHRRLGDRSRLAIVWGNLGYVALHGHQLDMAERRFTESIKLFLELGSYFFASDILVGFAAVAVARGQPEHAARLLAVASAAHQSTNINFEPSEQQEYDRTLSSTRAVLDEERFSALWAEGSAMSLEQAVHYALNRRDASMSR